MIKLFQSTDKQYSSNGDIVITPLKAKVHKEDNGAYYLDIETGIEYAEYLTEGVLLVANTPQGEQAFRVSNPMKTRSKVTIKAQHVFFDSANYLIADSYVVDKNCNDALDHLNSATDQQSSFTTLSNITTVNSFRCVRKSLYEALETVIERWGGHLYRNNWTIGILDQIGQDNGVTVRYAKNLKNITCEENWDNVVTKLLPVGKDGILLNAIDRNADLYVYSETQYDIPYTKTVSFEQEEIAEDDYQNDDGELNESEYKAALVADLKTKAQIYVEQNSVPQINYTLNANIDKITDVGDVIEVIDERLGVNLITNLIAFDYDCILKQYTSLEFGNFKKKLSGLISDITAETTQQITDVAENLAIVLTQEQQAATDKIWAAMSNSYVIYEGDKILVVDSLPKETARNVLMINNGGIGFSQTGINGVFTSAWTIDGTLNMAAINAINLTADLIKGGTLKLGANSGVNGRMELYDAVNNLIGQMDENGLKMYGQDGSYVLLNNNVGFAGYDRLGNKIYWAASDEFHMKKSVVTQEITLCNKVRFIPITLTSGSTVLNDGIGLVSVAEITGG